MKTIKINDKGLEVQILQASLALSITGTFSADTKIEVIAYQKNKGLASDGIVGPLTWAQISLDAKTIRKRDKNNWVKVFQLYVGLKVDGDFGSNTYKSARTFQSANKLSVDGIIGPKSWSKIFGTVSSVSPPSGTETAKPVNYKQYDSRWGKIVYTRNNTYNRKQTISSSGCGPTAMANIVATWKDKSITPKELAALSVANGYRTTNSGTSWGFFKFIAQKYKFSKFIQTSSYATAEAAIKDGALAVCSMKPGRWTKGGHFITWWKVDSNYVYINDPASSSSSRAKAPKGDMKAQCKQFFIFYK